MLTQRSPHEAYRRVEFDARVIGASSDQLVLVCYEQLGAALARALHAAAAGDNREKSAALTRALTAIAALQMGIDPVAGIAPVLGQFYGAARAAVLDCAIEFRPEVLIGLRADFAEIARSFAAAG